MTEFIIKVLIVVAWSAFKFMVGLFVATGFGFNFLETLITTVGGGMLGVIIYLYLWDFLILIRNKIIPPKPMKGIKMTKWRRMLVKFAKTYEIYGVVVLTPVLLSVPVGTLIAASLEHNKWKIKRYMFVAFVAWTCVLYSIYKMFGFRLDEFIDRLF